MRERKRRMELFSFYDRSGVEEHLARMAEKGWLLEKIGKFLWTYRRTEPRKLHFCVYWYSEATEFDPGPSPEQETLYDFCSHTGWVLAASFGPMQVFCNEADDPVPIETDPAVEVDVIHRAMKRGMLPGYAVCLAVSALSGGMFLSRLLDDPVSVLASPVHLCVGLYIALLLLLAATECGSYFLWHRRAVRAAARGEFWKTRGHRKFQFCCLAILLLGIFYNFVSILLAGDWERAVTELLIYGVYLPGVVLLAYGVRAFLKRKQVSAGDNRAATIVTVFLAGLVLNAAVQQCVLYGSAHGWFLEKGEPAYTYRGRVYAAPQDDLPLALEDLMPMEYDGGYVRKRKVEESFLLARYEMTQQPRLDAEDFREMPWLFYEITVVKVPALYEMCKNAKLSRWERRGAGPEEEYSRAVPVDPVPWRAREAYRLEDPEYGLQNIFLLCYEKHIVEMNFPEREITSEQIAAAAEKLEAFL